MARKLARDYAYKLVFEYLFLSEQENNNTHSYDVFFADDSLTLDDKAYIKTVVSGVKVHYQDFMSVIMEHIKGFSLERTLKSDMAAMLIACYELKYMPDIPSAVSINECIELVKLYGTEQSSNYVNGILANVSKEMNNDKNN